MPSYTFGAGPWSISTWYCPENLAGYQHLLSADDNNAFLFKIASSGDPNPGKVYLYAGSMIPGGSKFGSVIAVNAWSHIVLTYESGVLSIYVNGVRQAQVNVTMNISARTFRIGNGPGTGEYSNGWQSDLRYYGKALSQAEVQEIYGAG